MKTSTKVFIGIGALLIALTQLTPKNNTTAALPAKTEEVAEGKAVDLNADFRTTGNYIIIVNHDKFGYQELDVAINEDYHYQAKSLAPGADITIPIREFTTENGTRFLPLTTKVQSISLYTETSDGNYGKTELERK